MVVLLQGRVTAHDSQLAVDQEWILGRYCLGDSLPLQ